jgi:YfiH family protein
MIQANLLKNKEYYRFENFLDSGVVCAFSHRHSGNMSLVYGDKINSLENRKKFLSNLDINYRDLICGRQIHGSNIRYVKTEDKGRGALSYESVIADTDAFISDEKNLPVAIFTADCLSLFLSDSKKPALGLIHAGWRSTKENIAAKTIQFMQEIFHTRPEDLYVGFGPGIRNCCYDVEKDFKNLFGYGLSERNGLYYLDLAGINRKQLLDAGVKDAHIFDPGICTSCRNNEFFSYRKEGKSCGRMISAAMLK